MGWKHRGQQSTQSVDVVLCIDDPYCAWGSCIVATACTAAASEEGIEAAAPIAAAAVGHPSSLVVKG